MKYKYTSEMREISGFGNGYEDACRNMVVVGLEWLDEHKSSDPKATESPQIFGMTFDENEDMQDLQNAMSEAVEDCTGAMMHACTNHVMYIKNNGWEKYVEEMTEK